MKKLLPTLLLTVAIISVFAFSACTETGKEPGRYYQEDEGFSIVLPDSWETTEGLMGTDLIAVSQTEGETDNFAENVTIAIEAIPSEMTLQEYYDLNIGSTQEILEELTILEEESTTVDNKEARKTTYKYTMAGIEIKAAFYLFVTEDRGFMINYAGTVDSYATYEPTFDEITQSFRTESKE